jgi:hypothetical protein
MTVLYWVAAYHDGSRLYESESGASSEQIDRAQLRRFTLVDDDGQERFALDFSAGDDPRLVYRRRSEVSGSGVPLGHTYLAGYHHADGRLEMWRLDDGAFVPDPDPDVALVACEQF